MLSRVTKVTIEKHMTRSRWIFITVVGIIFIAFSVYRAFASTSYADAAGWVQVILGILGIPILYHELSQIRQAIDQKPIINVGVGSVNDLPLSNIRDLESLPKKTNIGQGYPHFWLIIRNIGKVAAKSVKIHVDFNSPTKKSLYFPVMEIDEWLGDNRYSFKKVNNEDFVFIGGSEWVLHANDTDIFGFYMTTVVMKQTEPIEIREPPELSDNSFTCTVWADGLAKPVFEKLIITIKESI